MFKFRKCEASTDDHTALVEATNERRRRFQLFADYGVPVNANPHTPNGARYCLEGSGDLFRIRDLTTGEVWESDQVTLASVDWSALGHPGIDREVYGR